MSLSSTRKDLGVWWDAKKNMRWVFIEDGEGWWVQECRNFDCKRFASLNIFFSRENSTVSSFETKYQIVFKSFDDIQEEDHMVVGLYGVGVDQLFFFFIL